MHNKNKNSTDSHAEWYLNGLSEYFQILSDYRYKILSAVKHFNLQIVV